MTRPPDADALSWVHAGRIRAAARELAGLIGQVTAIARDGRDPAGRGPGYAPLPPDSWDALAALLADLAALGAQAAALAGTDPSHTVAGPAATRAAVNARLGHAEDTVADLRPDRLEARYGSLPPGAAAELERLSTDMRDLLARAREVMRPDAS